MLFTPVSKQQHRSGPGVKVSFSSVPAERMQIVGSLAEFFMQIGHAGRVASLYSKGIVSPVLGPDEEAPFWKSDAW